MGDALSSFVEKLKTNSELGMMDEAATKQAILLPVLQFLGWQVFDIAEVYPEYPVKGTSVDYCLRIREENRVFIEAKRVREALDNHEEQLVGYAFKEGVKLAVLTNGVEWRLYLPLEAGSWDRRNFFTINLLEQKTSNICEKLDQFLSKRNVEDESAVTYAQEILKSRKRTDTIRKALPEAWRRILAEPDELLVDIIAERTEAVCGYRPEGDDVALFISNLAKPESTNVEKAPLPIKREVRRRTSESHQGLYIGKKINAFILEGKRYPIDNWISMLIQLCAIMAAKHPEEFPQVLTLRGSKLRYFSKEPEDLVYPKDIPGTDVYAEAKLNSDSIVRNARDVLRLMGYSDTSLEIETA